MLRKIYATCSSFIGRLENVPISVAQWFAILGAIIFLRTFFEGILARADHIISAENSVFFFLHAPMLYVVEVLGIILVLRIITKERIQAISSGILFAVGLLMLISPLAEVLVVGNHGIPATYYRAPVFHSLGEFAKYFYNFLLYGPVNLFFGSNPESLKWLKINYGVRIEVLLSMLVFVWYIFLKTKSAIKALGGFLLACTGVFVVGIFPSLMETLFGYEFVGPLSNVVPAISRDFGDMNKILFSYLLIVFILEAAWWLYFYNKEKFFAVIKNLRFTRSLAAVGALLGGLWLGVRHLPGDLEMNNLDILMVAVACLSGMFRWFWVVNENDLADSEGDRVSMPHRPIPSAALARDEIRTMSFLFFAAATISSIVVGYTYFVMGILMSCVAYLYSARPVRLKRLPVVANMALAVTYVLVVASGFLLVDQNSIFNFPIKIAALIFLVCSLGSEFKDIRDYGGDLRDGVKTLPVIFGLERGKKIIGALGVCAFLLVPIFYQEYFSIIIIPTVICAALYYYFVTKKNYREMPIFILYSLFAIMCAAFAYFGIIVL